MYNSYVIGGTLVIFSHFSTDSLSCLMTLAGSELFTTALPDTIILAPACVHCVCVCVSVCVGKGRQIAPEHLVLYSP